MSDASRRLHERPTPNAQPDALGFYVWPNVPCECPEDARPGERCSRLWICCAAGDRARGRQPYGRARARGLYDVRREEQFRTGERAGG